MSFRLAQHFAAGLVSIVCFAPAIASALEWETVIPGKVEKVILGDRCFVVISGSSGASAKAITGVNVSTKNGSAEVLVQDRLVATGSSIAAQTSLPIFAAPGSTGDFEILIPLRKPEVRQILFGEKRIAIWKSDGPKNDCPDKQK